MGLRRDLRLRSVVSTSAGITFSCSCFVAAVQVARYTAGDTAWIAILVSGALCTLSGACFAELNGLAPSAAGFRLYITRAFNEKLAIALSLLYMMIVTGVVGTESYVISHVLSAGLPAVSPLAWILIMLLAAVLLNVRGIRVAGIFQDVITYGLVTAILGVSLVALYKHGLVLRHPFSPGSLSGVLRATALGVFLYVGFEWAAPLAEEVTDFKLVGRGMMIALGMLSVTYAIFTVALSSTVGVGGLANSPIPHILFAKRLFGKPGLLFMVALSLGATVTTYNAGLITVSRFLYASAREGLIPKVFCKINLDYATPVVAIYTVFAVALATSVYVYVTRQYLLFVNLAAGIECVVYAFAGAAVLSLRRKQPQADRPYRVWGGNIIPILTVGLFALLALGVLAQDLRVAVILPLGFAACLAYTQLVVPRLKARRAARAAARRARRPSRRRRAEADCEPAQTQPDQV